jgi:hypothetical protein
MGKKNLKAGWNLCPCPLLLFVMREKCQIGRIDLNNQVFYDQLQSFVLLLSDEAICHHLVGKLAVLGSKKKGDFQVFVPFLDLFTDTITKNRY